MPQGDEPFGQALGPRGDDEVLRQHVQHRRARVAHYSGQRLERQDERRQE